MTRDRRTECIFERAQVTALPQVADGLAALQSELRPSCRHFIRREAPVEKADGHRAVRQRPYPDLEALLFPDSRGGASERILVDVDDLVVGEQRQREGIERGE